MTERLGRGRVYLSSTSRMLPLEPEVIVINPFGAALVNAPLESGPPIWPWLLAAVPFPSAIYSMECLMTACRKSFLTKSLTKMRSGAYGDFPPNDIRARTRAFAAPSRLAVRSTIAIAREVEGEERMLGWPAVAPPFWMT